MKFIFLFRAALAVAAAVAAPLRLGAADAAATLVLSAADAD